MKTTKTKPAPFPFKRWGVCVLRIRRTQKDVLVRLFEKKQGGVFFDRMNGEGRYAGTVWIEKPKEYYGWVLRPKRRRRVGIKRNDIFENPDYPKRNVCDFPMMAVSRLNRKNGFVSLRELV